jgi:hypothetical protein
LTEQAYVAPLSRYLATFKAALKVVDEGVILDLERFSNCAR